MLEALGGGAADDGGNGPPLGGHQLGQVQQLFLLLPRPLRLLDARVQPLVPAQRLRTSGCPVERLGEHKSMYQQASYMSEQVSENGVTH